MSKREDYARYACIVAWGRMLGSMDYYIEDEVAKAVAENAPENATYQREDGWHTTDGIANATTREEVERAAENIRSSYRRG